MVCQICGAKSGFYPLCKNCFNLKDEGKITKCEDCGIWKKGTKPLCYECWLKNKKAKLKVSDSYKTSDIEVKGINIVTMGTHARRTWMTYNKILDKKYDIGVISLQDYNAHTPRSYKVLKTICETIRIVYYWFILIPY